MYGTSTGQFRVEPRRHIRNNPFGPFGGSVRRFFVVLEEHIDPQGFPFDVIHGSRPTLHQASRLAKQLRGR